MPKLNKLFNSTRILNNFTNNDINTIADLTNKTKYELLRMKNMGYASVAEIEKTLSEHGLELSDEPEYKRNDWELSLKIENLRYEQILNSHIERMKASENKHKERVAFLQSKIDESIK